MTRLTLLTLPDCGYCNHAKGVLRRLRAEFDYAVDEIDLTGSIGQALAEEHAVPFAPGLLIDGEMFGFGRISERRLRKALAQRGTDRATGEPG